MRQIQSALAVLCVYLVASPAFAQQQNFRPQPGEDTTPRIDPNAPGEHWYSRFTNKYEPRIVPPVNVSNSGRLDQLIRAGNLYLSLQDAIALALENNIDIEMQRYGFQLADIDVTRTKTGASARGVATGTAAGASSVQGGPGYFVGSAASGIGTTGGAGGPLITSFDPTLTGQYNWAHFTQPSNNTITTGTTLQVTQQTLANFGVTQGFASGTSGTFSYNNTLSDSNAIRNNFNPTTNSSFDLQVTQHLLQGFGFAVNTRYIRIANN